MALDRDDLGRLLKEHTNHVQAAAVALFVVVASIWIGRTSRADLVPLDKQLHDLQATNTRLGEWRKSFRAPDARELALIAGDTTLIRSIAFPVGNRMQVAQVVAHNAEDAGLSEIRLSFGAPPDAASVPPRGRIGAVPVSIASYVVNIEGAGSFAAALKFVSNLPPSVTLTHFGATPSPAGATYHVILSVYEVPQGANGNG